MIAVSTGLLDAIRYPHLLAVEATAYPPIGAPVPLDVEDGSVTIDRTADHRRRLDLTLSNQLLYPISPGDPLAVYGSTIIVKRGVRFANGLTELVQLGVFRVEDASRAIPTGGVQVSGWDQSRQVLDERFVKPRKFASQLATTLIQLLITEVFPGAVFEVLTADTTTIPKHVVDQDRWPEIQRVAAVIGCEVFVTETGVWRIQDVPDLATSPSVWTVDAGEGGVLIGATDTVTREGAPNAVVVTGEGVSGNNAPIYGIATDDDPNSPTLYGGSYGRVPRFYSSPHIRTQGQADRVAAAQLADHLGVSRTISFESIANPALEAGDVVTVKRPDGTSELHIVDSISIGLSPSGTLTGETRAQDWATT